MLVAGENMAKWRGIKVNKLGRCVKVDWHGRSLTGPLPAELLELTELTELNLTGNKLSGEIPLDIGKLSNLTNLNLKETGIVGVLPPSLAGLAKLEKLALQGNEGLVRAPSVGLYSKDAVQAYLATL